MMKREVDQVANLFANVVEDPFWKSIIVICLMGSMIVVLLKRETQNQSLGGAIGAPRDLGSPNFTMDLWY